MMDPIHQLTRSAELSTRDKVFATARELFYRDGFQAVGIDTIVANAGVAKTSLYRWFPSKDELIVAVLESLHDEFWAQWEAVAEKHEGDARGELLAQLRWIGKWITDPRSRGCPLLNAAAEFPAPSHPARAVVLRSKQLLRRRLLQLSMMISADDPQLLADQLTLLIDGAFADSQAFGKKGPAASLALAGAAIVDLAANKGRRND
ncbi:MAG: TetR/AcrR family transcriptional regulator [Rhodanobacter sp.]